MAEPQAVVKSRAAWSNAPAGLNDMARLELACKAFEAALPKHIRARTEVREVVMYDVLHLTPAEIMSIEPWCDGFGDDEDCRYDLDDPCMGCRDAGFKQEARQ